MAYDKKKMIEQSIDAIKKYQLIYIEEIFAFTPFGKTTFYEHKLNEADDIIIEIENVKITGKNILRTKWLDSKSPYLQQLLYRLYANGDELSRIRTMDKQDSSDKDFTGLMKENAELKKELNTLQNERKAP